MEGLEISVIQKKEIFTSNKRRLNSEFYIKKIIKYRAQGGQRLESLLSYNKRGIQPLYSDDGSIRALRSVNIREVGITGNRDVFITDEFYKSNKRGIVKKGDVLLTSTGVGTLGRACVVLDNERYFVDGHITVLRTKKIMNTTLFLFLNSPYGQIQINALYNGSSGQIEIYPDDIDEILIPEFSYEFQKKLDDLIVQSSNATSQSTVNYNDAEKVLLKAIGLKSLFSSDKSINIKSFNESYKQSSRLDAEYYQPKFDELETFLLNTKSAVKLGEELKLNKRGTQPLYSEVREGLPVLNSKHIRENKIEFTDVRYGKIDKTDSVLIIKKNDVLINGTGVGTIGRSAVYLKDEPALPDNHVTILRTKDIDPVFLSVQLNSIIGKLQVEKYYKGSSGQIELYPADINEFIIWKAPVEIQKEIRKKIEESEELRTQSERLLSLAKQAVEIAIEQNEAVALAFIKENSGL